MKSVLIDRRKDYIYTRKCVFSFILLTLFSMLISGCGATDSNSADANKNFVELSVNTDSNQTSISGENNSNTANESEMAAAKGTPSLKGANLFDLLRQKMKETPSITAKELAAHGNDLIKQHGFNFSFDLQGKHATSVDLSRSTAAENDSKIEMIYDFTLADNSKKTFHVMNPAEAHPCGAVLDLPVAKINEKGITFVASIDGKNANIAVLHDKDLSIEEVHLVNEKDKRIIRKWFAPIDAYPIGISEDGEKIYVETWEFHQDQTQGFKEIPLGLALEIDSDGNLHFINANDIISQKGEAVPRSDAPPFTRFKAGSNEYTLVYESPCT